MTSFGASPQPVRRDSQDGLGSGNVACRRAVPTLNVHHEKRGIREVTQKMLKHYKGLWSGMFEPHSSGEILGGERTEQEVPTQP